jgi:predicted 3-demethylubiquinone-9 3-methyltransferase (glyoxalase superfamily)
MTTQGFATCLWFNGQAEEAANYYVSIFKDAKLGRVTYYTEAVPAQAGTVMTVELEVNGQKFLGLNGGPQFTFNEAISFYIFCADQDEIDYYWNALTEGGEEGPCGWLKDKYGVSWQVVPTGMIDMINDPDGEKAKRVTEAMFKMKKFDVAAIQQAYNGLVAAGVGSTTVASCPNSHATASNDQSVVPVAISASRVCCSGPSGR